MKHSYTSFNNSEALWSFAIGKNGEKRESWYDKSLRYWEQVPASNYGMLGGYQEMSEDDLIASSEFLDNVESLPSDMGGPCNFKMCLDCASGIGRVSEGVLLKKFEKVELLDPVERFLLKAKNALDASRVNDFHCCKLQDFYPKQNFYDCIWIQWCLEYMTDEDVSSVLKRFIPALKEKGVVCIKDNFLYDNFYALDDFDGAATRTDKALDEVIKDADFDILLKEKEKNYPEGLTPVIMYCLRPKLKEEKQRN